jgi:shikimate dehydrogenase
LKAIAGHTKVLGVFGRPIGHSVSPAMHNAALNELGLDYVYVAFDVDPAWLERAVQAVRALGMAGVNVTIPHKEEVIRFLDEVSPEARLVGSVNTISNVNGRLRGDSTDGAGFLQAFEEIGAEVREKRAVLLGAGGSARAVLYALLAKGASVTIVNRTMERGEKLAAEFDDVSPGNARAVMLSPDSLKKAVQDADLLVNCTSVGMWPRVEESPCPEEFLHSGLLVYDLVYNPLRTKLIRDAEKAGAATISGLKMLVFQGAVSFKIWTGYDPPIGIMENAALDALAVNQAQTG